MSETLEGAPRQTTPPGEFEAETLSDLPSTVRDPLARALTRYTAHRAPIEVIARVGMEEAEDTVARLCGQSAAHFVDLFAHVPGEAVGASRAGQIELHLLLALEQAPIWLHLIALPREQPAQFSSLISHVPATDWYEREVWDETGIEPRGHPALTRLRLPTSWPADAYPGRGMPAELLAVSSAGPEASGEARLPLAGEDDGPAVLDPGPEGLVNFPLGPVRSGVVESGHYVLRTVGEEIVDFHLRLFYKHRGVEWRAAGLTPLHLPLLAERISGTSGFAHALATCEALERAAGAEVPARARYLRTCYAELERLYNHLGYHADLCQATGLVVGQAQFEILKERILRLNARLTGHRYLFGTCVFGGVASDPAPELLQEARAMVTSSRKQVRRLGNMLLGSPSHVDRLEHTGVLPNDEARAWAVVGPVARASGIDRDVRRDFPYAAYDEVAFDVPVHQTGDALARAQVRLEEINQSLRILDQVLDRLPLGPTRAEALDAPRGRAGLGWVESPRGEGVHWLRLDHDGRVARYRVRTASFANAQAFPLCIPGRNILTDFPVIEQSWGLSYAGVDR